MTRISEKMIAASKLKRRIGCSVTSAANSGVKHRSRKPPALARTSRYSGRYRPAWRISQIGGSFCLRPESTSSKGFVASIWVKRVFRKRDREAGLLLLIHCGYGLGHDPIGPEIGGTRSRAAARDTRQKESREAECRLRAYSARLGSNSFGEVPIHLLGNARVANALYWDGGPTWLRNSTLRRTTSMPPIPAKPLWPTGT